MTESAYSGCPSVAKSHIACLVGGGGDILSTNVMKDCLRIERVLAWQIMVDVLEIALQYAYKIGNNNVLS